MTALEQSLKDEFESAFRQFYGLEAVTLRRRRTVAGVYSTTDVPVPRALRLDTQRPHQSLAQQGLDSSHLTWLMLARDVDPNDDTPPRAGDLIIDSSGTEWTIRHVRLEAWDTRYALECSQGKD